MFDNDSLLKAESFLSGLKLSKLPLELLMQIWELSSDALLWRLLSVLDLSSTTDSSPLSIELLDKVEGWSRFSKDSLKFASSPLKYILITLDAFGIQNIEQLIQPPAFRSDMRPDLAFLLIERGTHENDLLLYTKVSNIHTIFP